MRKTRKLAALIICALVACVIITGCGKKEAKDYRQNFAGTWEAMEMSGDGNQGSASDFEKLKGYGLGVYLELREDGTMALETFGSAQEGTWEAPKERAGTITMSGQKIDMNLSRDNILTLTQENSKIGFKQIDPSQKLVNVAPDAVEPTVEETFQEGE